MPTTKPFPRHRLTAAAAAAAGGAGRRQLGGRGAFTIAESMIASVVLAACVVAVGSAVNISYSQTQIAEDDVMATSFARQMLEEIAAKPFEDPNSASRTCGPESDETGRIQFDNIDDYDGYSDDSTSQLIADGTTRDISKSRVFAREVSVEYRSSPQGPADPTGDLLFVTVTVTTPDGRTVSLPRLMSSLEVE